MKKQDIKQLRILYIRKMIPHLLPIEAKKLGILPSDKARWHKLSQEIKAQLNKKFDSQPISTTISDMSFNDMPIKISWPNPKNFKDNDQIINALPITNPRTLEWIREKRINMLSTPSYKTCNLENLITDLNYSVYQRMPMVINNHIYFAEIYLPDYDIVIENAPSKKLSAFRKQKVTTRLEALESKAYRLIIIHNNQSINLNYVKNILMPYISVK